MPPKVTRFVDTWHNLNGQIGSTGPVIEAASDSEDPPYSFLSSQTTTIS